MHRMKPLKQIPLPTPRRTPEQEQLEFDPYENREIWGRLLISDMQKFLVTGEPRSLMGAKALRERVERRFGFTTTADGAAPPMLETREESWHCLAYSEKRAWIRVLAYELRMQVRWGRKRRSQGPAGLRDRMDRLYAFITARATASTPST